MARGRHRRRSSLLSRLRARVFGPPVPPWREVHALAVVTTRHELAALEQEVARLRSTESLTVAAAVASELRAQRLERELAAARAELAEVRADLASLREELVWAFAERKLAVEAAAPAVVVDLTTAKDAASA